MRSGSAEHVVHRVDEFLHGGFGFVAHVGDAEGGAFDFAVTAVDEEVVLGLQVLNEAGEVKAFGCFEARQCERSPPLSPTLRSSHELSQRPSSQKQIPSSHGLLQCEDVGSKGDGQRARAPGVELTGGGNVAFRLKSVQMSCG